jgi:Zn-dependent protease with chaperone function
LAIALLAAALWFVIAYFAQQRLIGWATGASGVTRKEAPQLYNAPENLCISPGLSAPALQIIKTPALNAYASKLREGQYVVVVTCGLVDSLAADELEAVLAHARTQIRNRDTQLMVIAVIFAGIFALFGDLLIRAWDCPYGCGPTRRGRRMPGASNSEGGSPGRSSAQPGPAILAAAIILICWGPSVQIYFALSRAREFLADAGSAELTKNLDAPVWALRQIYANAASTCPYERRPLASTTRSRSASTVSFPRTLPSSANRSVEPLGGGRYPGLIDQPVRSAGNAPMCVIAKAMGIIVDADQHRGGGIQRHGQGRAGCERTHVFRRHGVAGAGAKSQGVLVVRRRAPEA